MKNVVLLESGKRERVTKETFMNDVYPEPNTGCWIWGKSLTEKGYGNVQKKVKGHVLRGSHRVSFYIHNGPFNYSLLVCHKCDNPICVNPDHLFLGTTQENTFDMKSKGRASHGESRPTAKLNETQVINIRTKYATGNYTTRELAKEYDIDHGNVAGIIRRATWRHV